MMGIPQHYSHQLPNRCLQLVEWLYPLVAEDKKHGRLHGGPLTTTLLLSLATPMIVLPLERIFKQLNGTRNFADETEVDPILTDAVRGLFKKPINASDFSEDIDWAFSGGHEIFNLADRLPGGIAYQLATNDAREAAARMPFTQFASILRNALSHGGVLYLDERGQSSDNSACMLAFVSGKLSRTKPTCQDNRTECMHAVPPIEEVNVLRVSEIGFLEFLRRWGNWMRDSGATTGLSGHVSPA